MTDTSVIVTDEGFRNEDWTQGFAAPEDLAVGQAAGAGAAAGAVDLRSDADPAVLDGRLADIALIRVDFPHFADGRGFTIARQIRRMGFKGRLRAKGHVIADQYAMVRRSGFDEVEISGDLARRQPENHWRSRSGWRSGDYQTRLRGAHVGPLAEGRASQQHTESQTCKASSRKSETPGTEVVTSVRHYTDRLFSFRTTRPRSLRFRSGEFVMIGLVGDNGKPLYRAYSIASQFWNEELEFYSVKVPGGPLTSKLQHIRPGDRIFVRSKPVGSLVHDALLPGKRLWLFATGTGFAPFASILRDPETYEKYEQIVTTHTCRTAAELTYSKEVVAGLPADPLVGGCAAGRLTYYPTTTREPAPKTGRITTLLRDGTLLRHVGAGRISAETDRVMVCGSVGFNLDMKGILNAFGLEEGANSEPGHFVVEKAFVG